LSGDVTTRFPFHLRTAGAAAVWYAVLAVAMTWPLATGLGRDLPWDLGDPLLNCWILAHDASRIVAALSGHPSALAGFWTAGIFHPEPLTLAFSEALIPQALQILPVWALTRNPVLCYNLLFLSTFVLSGVGVYLWVRALTADARAAFVAGLLYAFALYRVGQFSHLQVLSSQWMPFVLFAFRRYFDTGHRRALAGAALALWAQSLSCGYYLLYFAPVLAAYLLWELSDRGLWRRRRALADVGIALAASAAATVPFLVPYLEVRARGIGTRPRAEILSFSADVYSYLSTRHELRIWGDLAQVFPKPEGELFPGVVAPALAAIGLAVWLRRNLRASSAAPLAWRPERWARALAISALVVVLAYATALVVVLAGGRINIALGPIKVLMASAVRLLQSAAVAAAVLLAASPRARAFVRGVPGSVVGFSAAAAFAAFLLSLGPQMRTLGHSIGTGPYAWLMLLPGYDGVRVPARFGMIGLVFLSVLGGYGAAALGGWRRRAGPLLVALSGALFLAEATVVPLPTNVRLSDPAVRLTAPGPVRQGDDLAPVYRAVAALDDAVLIEFPFGFPAYELQYMFASIWHGTPLVNGYSGAGPPAYGEQIASLGRAPFLRPDRSWQVLARSSATHAIVHANAFNHDEGRYLEDWLVSHGARLVGVYGDDRLFALPRGRP
jgi:hypothetical protein